MPHSKGSTEKALVILHQSLWSGISGKLTLNIKAFNRENGAEEATEADCFMIVKYFDSDGDLLLDYQDFL